MKRRFLYYRVEAGEQADGGRQFRNPETAAGCPFRGPGAYARQWCHVQEDIVQDVFVLLMGGRPPRKTLSAGFIGRCETRPSTRPDRNADGYITGPRRPIAVNRG